MYICIFVYIVGVYPTNARTHTFTCTRHGHRERLRPIDEPILVESPSLRPPPLPLPFSAVYKRSHTHTNTHTENTKCVLCCVYTTQMTWTPCDIFHVYVCIYTCTYIYVVRTLVLWAHAQYTHKHKRSHATLSCQTKGAWPASARAYSLAPETCCHHRRSHDVPEKLRTLYERKGGDYNNSDRIVGNWKQPHRRNVERVVYQARATAQNLSGSATRLSSLLASGLAGRFWD